MQGINRRRWLIGGIAAGALIWVLDGSGSILYVESMEAAMTAHGLSTDTSVRVVLLSVAVSLIVGLAVVFFYALARARLGPGPRTAVIVAIALWISGSLVSLIGYDMIGLYPRHLLLGWALVALVAVILGSLLGAWIYREE